MRCWGCIPRAALCKSHCSVWHNLTRRACGCSDVEYLNSRDATIMGSRNGHAPIYMWYTLTRKGYEGMRKDVERCLRNAHLLKVGLRVRV